MHILAALLGTALIVSILFEGFETVVQPRRVSRKYRIARVYLAVFWISWRWIGTSPLRNSRRRSSFLSAGGPLSLLGLFAIWVVGLVAGFGLLDWGLHDAVSINVAGGGEAGIWTYFYMSGTTLFTLGYGDVTPIGPMGRMLAVVESGLGFGFLAAILSYLPALFQAYSKREVSISMLDARAGSPPTAAQLILRAAQAKRYCELDSFLGEWERWAAELLESQLSFPVLAYYRSQHDNQSWLAALTAILDTCAVILTLIEEGNTYQAQMTFAIARHAAVDLALVLRAKAPHPTQTTERLSPAQFAALQTSLKQAGLAVRDVEGDEESLRDLRASYEPFIQGLAQRLLLIIPPVVSETTVPDNWQRSAWMKPTPGIGELPSPGSERHFG